MIAKGSNEKSLHCKDSPELSEVGFFGGESWSYGIAQYCYILIKCREVNNWVSTKPLLCSKRPIFNKLVWIEKVVVHSSHQGSTLPLSGALKWVTVWTSTSTGTRIMKGQR